MTAEKPLREGKKKPAMIIAAVVLALIAAGFGIALFLTNGFSFGRITGKVYNVRNVYDEIWNLLKREERGEETVLTASDTEASKVYELGVFDYIRIPSCGATLSNRQGTLWISVNTGEYEPDLTGAPREKEVSLEYDVRTKTLTLYDVKAEKYLRDRFLSVYFARQDPEKPETKYSLDDLGEYSVRIIYNDETPSAENAG